MFCRHAVALLQAHRLCVIAGTFRLTSLKAQKANTMLYVSKDLEKLKLLIAVKHKQDARKNSTESSSSGDGRHHSSAAIKSVLESLRKINEHQM